MKGCGDGIQSCCRGLQRILGHSISMGDEKDLFKTSTDLGSASALRHRDNAYSSSKIKDAGSGGGGVLLSWL